jgi:hypothetical protein
MDNISSCHIILENKGDKIPKDYLRKIDKMIKFIQEKYTKICQNNILR